MSTDDKSPPYVEFPIEDSIDLHTFHPRDIPALLTEYLMECRKKGIVEVRIIHGKGRGTLRNTVHQILDSMDCVQSYSLAVHDWGNWGATVVRLKRDGG